MPLIICPPSKFENVLRHSGFSRTEDGQKIHEMPRVSWNKISFMKFVGLFCRYFMLRFTGDIKTAVTVGVKVTAGNYTHIGNITATPRIQDGCHCLATLADLSGSILS